MGDAYEYRGFVMEVEPCDDVPGYTLHARGWSQCRTMMASACGKDWDDLCREFEISVDSVLEDGAWP